MAILGAAFFAAITAYVISRGWSWRWPAGTFAPTYVLVIWVPFRRIVRVGEGWLSSGKRFVRTDRLTRLRVERTSAGMLLSMRDDDGRVLQVRPSDIARSPDVWLLARAGVLASCAAGLTIDARAARFFLTQGS